jgi:succinyldiaminopimelate transaminase
VSQGPAGVPTNPLLARFATYPFVEIERRKRERMARGVDVVDLSIGDPAEPTPVFIVEALKAHLPERSSYPTVLGLPALRGAIAAWMARRHGVALDPATEILPANGSKEAIWNVHTALLDPTSRRRRVVYPSPAYPIYERAAAFCGGVPTPLPVDEAHGFLPDLGAVHAHVWDETAILWLNYPHNPTGAMAPLAFYAHALELAHRHGFIVCSDEAYGELTFDTPATTLLAAGKERALVFHTLSKRSAMTGYRSGFVAGDPALMAAFRALRPSLGVATPEFVQHAAIAAWNDDAHVARLVAGFRARRDEALAFLAGPGQALGLRVVPNAATFYLWLALPPGEGGTALYEHWLEDAGVAVVPGEFMGEGGAGYVRLALVPTPEACRTAWTRLAALAASAQTGGRK